MPVPDQAFASHKGGDDGGIVEDNSPLSTTASESSTSGSAINQQADAFAPTEDAFAPTELLSGQLPNGIDVVSLSGINKVYLFNKGSEGSEDRLTNMNYHLLQGLLCERDLCERKDYLGCIADGPAEGLSYNAKGLALKGITWWSPTTVWMQNLPLDYDRDDLCHNLDKKGFKGKYDFVYLPLQAERGLLRNARVGLGYGFVNACSNQYALDMMKSFHNFSEWERANPGKKLPDSNKKMNVLWANRQQGYDDNVEYWRNNKWMHGSVPDIYKPAVFRNGQKMRFPKPDKRLRAPTLRESPK